MGGRVMVPWNSVRELGNFCMHFKGRTLPVSLLGPVHRFSQTLVSGVGTLWVWGVGFGLGASGVRDIDGGKAWGLGVVDCS